MRLGPLLTLVAALGAGLVAGIFLAFSAGVMRALRRLPPPQAIAAMQSINVGVINPVFLGVFAGTAIVCAAVAALAVRDFGAVSAPGAGWRLAGALAYLAGSFGVTLVCNVPRNDALAALDPAGADAAPVWDRYLREWTGWNHVRLLAALAAAALLTLGLAAGRPG